MTIFDPESPRYILWDDTMAFIVLLLSIIYPYMAFFSSDYDSGTVIFHRVTAFLKIFVAGTEYQMCSENVIYLMRYQCMTKLTLSEQQTSLQTVQRVVLS